MGELVVLDGQVRELPMKARDVKAALAFPLDGTYRVEVMGYGKNGPEVLVNVPVQVGARVASEDRRWRQNANDIAAFLHAHARPSPRGRPRGCRPDWWAARTSRRPAGCPRGRRR